MEQRKWSEMTVAIWNYKVICKINSHNTYAERKIAIKEYRGVRGLTD